MTHTFILKSALFFGKSALFSKKSALFRCFFYAKLEYDPCISVKCQRPACWQKYRLHSDKFEPVRWLVFLYGEVQVKKFEPVPGGGGDHWVSVYGDGQMNKFEPVQGQRWGVRAGVGVEGGGKAWRAELLEALYGG